MMNSITVDARGEQCPIPVVKATRLIQELKEPALVEVHVDNEIAVQNLLRMASGRSFAARSERLEENHFVVTVEVDHPVMETGQSAPPATCAPDRSGSVVAAVGASVMGAGNDELGAVLMKGFLYALSQMECLPGTVLFYNGGAYLTCEGSASLEDLRSLEEQGVEILTCGTCLGFYGLKDKLAVGGVTNMYSIVEKLNQASHVIRP